MVANVQLTRAVEAAISTCLSLKRGESLLIITNPNTEQAAIAEALRAAALEAGIDSKLIQQPVKSQTDFAEREVLEAIANKPSAVASISSEKLGKDPELMKAPKIGQDGRSYDHIFTYLLHGTKELRAFWSPGATIDMFTRTVAIDYRVMRRRAAALSSLLDSAITARIVSPSGTDLELGLSRRKAFIDSGDFSAPGSGGNLPAGEVFISPALKTAEGEIVFDGSIADISGDIVVKEPIRCTLRGGYVVSADGGEDAERLEKALRWGMDAASRLSRQNGIDPETALRYATNARHLGEFGIGLNEMARVSGAMLEDEKAYGTCHFAIGSNYDEDAPAMIHLDGLVRSPTITLFLEDGREITPMLAGKLVSRLFDPA